MSGQTEVLDSLTPQGTEPPHSRLPLLTLHSHPHPGFPALLDNPVFCAPASWQKQSAPGGHGCWMRSKAILGKGRASST